MALGGESKKRARISSSLNEKGSGKSSSPVESFPVLLQVDVGEIGRLWDAKKVGLAPEKAKEEREEKTTTNLDLDQLAQEFGLDVLVLGREGILELFSLNLQRRDLSHERSMLREPTR